LCNLSLLIKSDIFLRRLSTFVEILFVVTGSSL
jgi:hypothetical protein